MLEAVKILLTDVSITKVGNGLSYEGKELIGMSWDQDAGMGMFWLAL